MKTICVLSNVLAPRMPERVVCRLRDTAATFDPTRELRSWDFPALGAPTIATSSRLRSWLVVLVFEDDASSCAGGAFVCL